MIVATAGHVDHGKTTIVRGLTGIDTDRLPEEKARGLTIDLGFAYRDIEGGARLGFVDVPGHERFVKNMLAGVSTIDYALLVVAADDGPMPQTREHLDILTLLGIARGAIAISKIDRVPAERLAEVELAVQAITAGGPLDGAPVFPVSGVTGDGMPALEQHLLAEARAHHARAGGGRFRLAVDRSFTLSGAGLVVTGACSAGEVRVGDRLLLSPGGLELLTAERLELLAAGCWRRPDSPPEELQRVRYGGRPESPPAHALESESEEDGADELAGGSCS